MDMLKQNFAEEPYKVIKERATFLKRWTSRCKELEASEKELHSSLEPHLQEVLHGKRLLGDPMAQLVWRWSCQR